MMAAVRSAMLSQTIGKTGYIYCINSQGVATVHPNAGVQGHSLAGCEFARKQSSCSFITFCHLFYVTIGFSLMGRPDRCL